MPSDPTLGDPLVARLRRGLAAMPLDHRFAAVGSLVALGGMLIMGALVSSRIETGVVRNSAISSAVYMESFIAPLSQELATSETFRPETIAHMRELLDQPPLSERIISAKIWRKGGLLAFSSDADLIGATLEPGENLQRAWAGDLTAEFDELEGSENLRERATGMPLLEVYNPIHSIITGEVIAVAEFYLNATELRDDLRRAHLTAWGVVAAVSLATFLALFGIVRAGSRTIDRQNRELTRRIAELARISAQNEALRDRVQAASRSASETNERYMRRISAELHDGPAQALALASLRLDSLMQRSGVPADTAEAGELRVALDEALRDVRDLCHGLALPELEGRSVADTLELAVRAHERRTGGSVARGPIPAGPLEGPAPHPTLICIYRFVQEGLMNAYRHGGGKGVRVAAAAEGGRLRVTVADAGGGFEPGGARRGPGLGLAGLRQRIESIGGEFQVKSEPGKGTLLTMELPYEDRS
ncbi:MAG: sensor histidine kinase [Rhodobacteraceae bacterium]|nr:sensor histidine kinase [Paracoccaceae bacterium]